MTVSSSYTDKVYQINGSTITFPWGQDLDTQYGSLVVTEETAASGGTVVTTYVEGTDYEVINKDVVFNTAPSDTTHYIHIARNTYKGQPVQFIEGEDFPAEDYEHSLDRLAMIAQEQAKGLEDEKSARIAADTTLDNKITAEANRAKAVEGSLSNLTTDSKNNLVEAINEVDLHTDNNSTNLSNHIADKNNPHEVTKAQVGLGNCDNTSDLNKPISTATQSALNGKVNTSDLGNAELDIQKNGTSVGKFKANASTDKVINIIVPTQASDVNALPDSTKYAASMTLSLDSSTYVVTAQLKDQDGNNIGSSQTIDLPLESVVVSGTYDSQTKSIILTLDNGNTITIPVGDLVDGLQSEITSSNKLNADLVDDSTSTNKFVTSSDKTTWNGKQDALTAGTNISITGGVISATDTTYSDFVGADGADAGSAGLVPAPAATDNTKFLKGDGTFSQVAYSEISGTPSLSGYQTTANLVTSVDSSSTDSQYPSAKLFYDTCGDIETLINAL